MRFSDVLLKKLRFLIWNLSFQFSSTGSLTVQSKSYVILVILTCVINDPLGQTHSPAERSLFSLEICFVLRGLENRAGQTNGRTYRLMTCTDYVWVGRVDQKFTFSSLCLAPLALASSTWCFSFLTVSSCFKSVLFSRFTVSSWSLWISYQKGTQYYQVVRWSTHKHPTKALAWEMVSLFDRCVLYVHMYGRTDTITRNKEPPFKLVLLWFVLGHGSLYGTTQVLSSTLNLSKTNRFCWLIILFNFVSHILNTYQVPDILNKNIFWGQLVWRLWLSFNNQLSFKISSISLAAVCPLILPLWSETFLHLIVEVWFLTMLTIKIFKDYLPYFSSIIQTVANLQAF